MWIATRKALEVAGFLGTRLLGSHLLHNMLHVKSTLPELSAAFAVLAELPANVEKGYEQSVLSFVDKVLRQRPRLLMIVQPSLRRRSNRSIWVSRWNQSRDNIPFKFFPKLLLSSGKWGTGMPRYHVCAKVRRPPVGGVQRRP